MTLPMFPKFTPRIVDPLWFNVDRPSTEEADLLQLENEHKAWLKQTAECQSNITPIGKMHTQANDDEEDDDDEVDSNDEEESETQDEEDEDMELDATFERGANDVLGSEV